MKRQLVPDDPRRLKLTVAANGSFAVSTEPSWDLATQPGLSNNPAGSGRTWMHFCKCEFGEVVLRAWSVGSALTQTYLVIEELEGGYS